MELERYDIVRPAVGSTDSWELPVEFRELHTHHDARLRRLGAHKERSLGMANWIRANQQLSPHDSVYNLKKACQLAGCGSYLLFHYYHSLEPPRSILVSGNTCDQHFFCPQCAIKRSLVKVREYYERYQTIYLTHSGLQLWYFVFTIKDTADLLEGFTQLEESIRFLLEKRRQALKAKSGKKYGKYTRGNYALGSVFGDMLGGCYSIEVKRGSGSGLWHPHINFMCLLDRPYSQADLHGRLVGEWQSVTGNSFIVHCEQKDHHDKGAFIEVLKYALKFSDMSFEDNFEAGYKLYRRRLFGTFGNFYGQGDKKLSLLEDRIDLSDAPYIALFYQYSEKTQRYNLAEVDLSPVKVENLARPVLDGEFLLVLSKINKIRLD